MANDPTIKQGWLHIYDKVDKKNNRRIRHVHDFLTENNYYDIDFTGTDFSSLEIIGRNINSELAYFEKEGIVKVSLSPMNRWPSTTDPQSYHEKIKLKHIRIDIGYNTLENEFEKNKIRGYKSLIYFTHRIVQEFHIYLPNGLKIKENNVFVDVNFRNSDDEIIIGYSFTNNKKAIEEIYQEDEEIDQNNEEIFPNDNADLLFFHKDAIENKYTIILNPYYYNKIDESIEHDNIEVVLRYEAVNSKTFFFIPALVIIAFALSIAELFSYQLLGVPFIAFISVGVLYLGLKNQNYEIPFERMVRYLFFLTIIILLIKCVSLEYHDYLFPQSNTSFIKFILNYLNSTNLLHFLNFK